MIVYSFLLYNHFFISFIEITQSILLIKFYADIIFIYKMIQEQRKKLLFLLKKELTRRIQTHKKYNWSLNARSNQRIPDGDWRIWF